MAPAIAIIGMIQAATVAGPDSRYAPRPAPSPRAEAPVRCDPRARGGDDIVVCAKPTDQRLRKLDETRFAEHPLTPTFRVAGAQAVAAAEQRALPDGKSGPAIMLNFKWKFGGKKKQP